MWRKREPYDPKIYGEVKAKFLNNVAGLSPYKIQEQERLKLIKDIREGKLSSIKTRGE